MSEPAQQETIEAPERALLRRTFAAELTSEGRTIDVRVVPYGITAQVSDDHRTLYREEWAPGCFDDQLVAGHRLKVLLNVEHEQGIRGIVGKGISLRSENDGLHGSFEVLRSGAGNTTLDLVNDGILDGVSLEALEIDPHPQRRRQASKPIWSTSRCAGRRHADARCRRP
jgi:phage head maturation protease